MDRLQVISENLAYIQASFTKEMIDRETARLEWVYKTWKEERDIGERIRKAHKTYREIRRDIKHSNEEAARLNVRIVELKERLDYMMIRFKRAYAIYHKWVPWMNNQVAQAKDVPNNLPELVTLATNEPF